MYELHKRKIKLQICLNIAIRIVIYSEKEFTYHWPFTKVHSFLCKLIIFE